MSDAPAPTRAEEGREAGPRCACSKVAFPLSLEPGYDWRCPCGISRMRSHAPPSVEDRAVKAEAEVARLTAALAEAERERDMARNDAQAEEVDAALNKAFRKVAEASASALRERVATLEAAMDATWKRVISYRMPQVCKHLVAANILSDMEQIGFEVPQWLAKAVVECDDETALSFDRTALEAPHDDK